MITADHVAKALSGTVCALPRPDRAITGAFCGDLLSWVMARAKSGDAWITIQANRNAVAVASLTDAACLILADGVTLSPQDLATAEENGVNVLSSPLSAFAIAAALSRLLTESDEALRQRARNIE